MLSTFYAAFAPLTFTVLGLWLVVVQTRHAEWIRSAEHRRMAYGVSLLFALPGLMSLLSLVDPSSSTVWRVSFAATAVTGVVALLMVGGRRRGPVRRMVLGEAAFWTAVVFYALIALVAIAPGVVHSVGIGLSALRVEAILLSLVVGVGVNLAWLLMFETGGSTERPATRPAGPTG